MFDEKKELEFNNPSEIESKRKEMDFNKPSEAPKRVEKEFNLKEDSFKKSFPDERERKMAKLGHLTDPSILKDKEKTVSHYMKMTGYDEPTVRDFVDKHNKEFAFEKPKYDFDVNDEDAIFKAHQEGKIDENTRNKLNSERQKRLIKNEIAAPTEKELDDAMKKAEVEKKEKIRKELDKKYPDRNIDKTVSDIVNKESHTTSENSDKPFDYKMSRDNFRYLFDRKHFDFERQGKDILLFDKYGNLLGWYDGKYETFHPDDDYDEKIKDLRDDDGYNDWDRESLDVYEKDFYDTDEHLYKKEIEELSDLLNKTGLLFESDPWNKQRSSEPGFYLRDKRYGEATINNEETKRSVEKAAKILASKGYETDTKHSNIGILKVYPKSEEKRPNPDEAAENEAGSIESYLDEKGYNCEIDLMSNGSVKVTPINTSMGELRNALKEMKGYRLAMTADEKSYLLMPVTALSEESKNMLRELDLDESETEADDETIRRYYDYAMHETNRGDRLAKARTRQFLKEYKK